MSITLSHMAYRRLFDAEVVRFSKLGVLTCRFAKHLTEPLVLLQDHAVGFYKYKIGRFHRVFVLIFQRSTEG